MSRDWDKVFSNWSSGPSNTEQTKINNAVNQIKKAINASSKLNNKNISIYVQGSYRNKVNVSLDSDVDVTIHCHNTFYWDTKQNIKRATEGIPSTYKYSQFKKDVYESLKTYFGVGSIKRGNKSIDINENSYRVDSDVVAVFDYRYYHTPINYYKGVKLIPDNGKPSAIVNWPEQHYNNGVKKNKASNRRYKRVVRILKKLRAEMLTKGYGYLDDVPGFLIECLVYNTPDDRLGKTSYYETINSVLIFLFDRMARKTDFNKWTEVSGKKYLFSSSQKWSKDNAQKFVKDAWNYVGYKK